MNIRPETKEDIEEVLAEAKAGIECFDAEILEKMKNDDYSDSF
jgi:hypothetical protein